MLSAHKHTNNKGLKEALAILAPVHAKLHAQHGPFASLAPDREEATSLPALAATLLGDAEEVDVCVAFGEGLARIFAAQVEHFPETLYWDIDFMAASLLEQGRRHGADALETLCEEVAGVQAQYGRHSIICFRYAHDFTYGYDWAKWVGRAPAEREGAGPFDARFIRYLATRGAELVELIATDDEKYPKLPSGKPRNPFGFAREPGHERSLFAELAAHDELPLKTWFTDAPLFWDGDYANLREQRACVLGIPTRASAREA